MPAQDRFRSARRDRRASSRVAPRVRARAACADDGKNVRVRMSSVTGCDSSTVPDATAQVRTDSLAAACSPQAMAQLASRQQLNRRASELDLTPGRARWCRPAGPCPRAPGRAGRRTAAPCRVCNSETARCPAPATARVRQAHEQHVDVDRRHQLDAAKSPARRRARSCRVVDWRAARARSQRVVREVALELRRHEARLRQHLPAALHQEGQSRRDRRVECEHGFGVDRAILGRAERQDVDAGAPRQCRPACTRARRCALAKRAPSICTSSPWRCATSHRSRTSSTV